MKSLRRLFVTCLVVGLLTPSAWAGPITQIVVFGDSISDTGNVFALSGTPPSPPYFQGRFSNGPVWVEGLASRLGVPAPTPSLTGGTNYAFGGALTGSGFSPGGVPNLGTQIGSYLAGNTPRADQLFVVWGGANDLFVGGPSNPGVPVSNLSNHISTLARAGAQKFLVGNYSLLGDTPRGLALSPATRQAWNTWSLNFNSLLEPELTRLESSLGITTAPIDLFTLFEQIRANPAAFGFTNITRGALSDGVLSGQGYLFWDTVHPTAAFHGLIADRAAQAVGVPEPSTLLLLANGGLGLLVWGWRRKRPGTALPRFVPCAVLPPLPRIPGQRSSCRKARGPQTTYSPDR
jgi:phospholipase/lecithinase/hemolysin